ncbi:interleukin-31 receptor subunit alpha-like [Aquila chrysaetos chrysaetos]|uniref:interleukin-31 receptor subunit alpha-like n=1 Tax=Aquila chrysaetos chrysaetos TaxID=223781 RepID=UPI00117677D9|nr:interleukin-31 receptor subunit alpha-like [Aquila chrysaetos chrysaetos]
MKNSLLAAIFLFATDSCNCTRWNFPFCQQLPDWDNELVCYKEVNEDLTCTWLPVPSAPNMVNYTVFLKWDRIPKLFQRNTSSSSITIERKDLYMKRSASIWIAVNYAHDSCVKGKNISVTPSKAGKCLTPSNINAHQITNQLIIKWDLPATPTPYELRYREALTESTWWTLVPVESSAVNVTISNLNAMSSYIIQLRCIAKDGLHCVCIWSKEILVPHKLTNMPRISYNATTEISPGRRSVLLKWEITQSENILGYYVNVERIPNSCRDSPNRFFLKDRKVLLNLSMAYYRINISAYNKAGESPQATYIVSDSSATDLPGQIHVRHQGTNAVVTWTPEYNPKCFVVDWGTGKDDMRMKIITTTTGNFMLDNFQPYKLYKIMVHASDVCQCESFTRHEKTFGVTHFYSVEGVPRTGPANVTILNITKHSALVKWTEIAAKDCLGVLQGYRISYTDSSRKKSLAVTLNSSTTSYHLTGLKEKTIYRVQISGFTKAGEGPPTLSQPFSTPKYDEGEFEGLVTGLCFSMMFILVFAPLTCSLVLKRLKISCWPSVPSPRNSSALQDMTNWKPISRSLLQALSDNDTTSLYVIEHESKAPLKIDLFTNGGEDSKCDACQSEEPTNNIDISLRHEEIPEGVTSEEEGIISITIPLLSDYTSMEFSQKALMSPTLKLPARAARPHLEMELSSKPAQTKHQVLFAPQDYLKQSQVVFLPSGPTLMGQVNSN